MAAIMIDSSKVLPMATAYRRRVMWRAAIITSLAFFGVAEMVQWMGHGEGTDLRSVRSRLVWEDGRKVLLIEGEVANQNRVTTSVAPIRLSVRDREGADLFTWIIAPPATHLSAGDRANFIARLPSPPEGGVAAAVRLERASWFAPPTPDRKAASPGARRIALGAPLRATGLDNIPNLRKMP